MESNNTNYCAACKVNVDAALENCPLCGAHLTEKPEENTLYPPLAPLKEDKRRTFAEELYLFLSLVFIGGSVVLNLIFWHGTLWCVSVAAVIFYAWIIIQFTIFSPKSGGVKIGCYMLGAMAVLAAFDYTAGFTGWCLNYGLPLILIAGLIAIDLYSFIHKSKWKDNLAFAIFYVILGAIPIILYFTKITTAWLPALLCAVAAGITVLGLIRFSVRYFAEEMRKRFHI